MYTDIWVGSPMDIVIWLGLGLETRAKVVKEFGQSVRYLTKHKLIYAQL